MSRRDDSLIGFVDARCDSAQQATHEVELAFSIQSKDLVIILVGGEIGAFLFRKDFRRRTGVPYP